MGGECHGGGSLASFFWQVDDGPDAGVARVVQTGPFHEKCGAWKVVGGGTADSRTAVQPGMVITRLRGSCPQHCAVVSVCFFLPETCACPSVVGSSRAVGATSSLHTCWWKSWSVISRALRVAVAIVTAGLFQWSTGLLRHKHLRLD